MPLRAPRRTTGNGNLEAAMPMLMQNQAMLIQNQGQFLTHLSETRRDIAELRKDTDPINVDEFELPGRYRSRVIITGIKD